MPEPDPEEIGEDALLGGAVRLLQARRGHRAGTDAVVLAAIAGARPNERVVDLGSGSGAVGLMIAARHQDASVTLVERDDTLVSLARRNIALNGMAGRVVALAADVFASRAGLRAAGLAAGTADLVVSNPPFFEEAHRQASPDPGRRRAHVMSGGALAGWLETAAYLARPRGRLVLIHRADQLALCLVEIGRGFGSIKVEAVHARAGEPAIRVVIHAIRGGRAPLCIAPPIVLHGDDGAFTRVLERMNTLAGLAACSDLSPETEGAPVGAPRLVQ